MHKSNRRRATECLPGSNQGWRKDAQRIVRLQASGTSRKMERFRKRHNVEHDDGPAVTNLGWLLTERGEPV